jgi:1-deoxy-D-xylulose-5-phosphate synthase
MAPSDEAELGRMLRLALSLDGPCAIRYPRDCVPVSALVGLDGGSTMGVKDGSDDGSRDRLSLGRSRILRHGSDVTAIVYGALASTVLEAASALSDERRSDERRSAERGIEAEVIDARFCKPLDADMLRRVLRDDHPVLTIEDHTVTNGFGSAVLEFAREQGLPTDRLTRLGHPADRMISHAKRSEQLSEVGLDVGGVSRAILSLAKAVDVGSYRMARN